MSRQKIIPIGPYHPLQEEPEYFKLYCEGETVVDVEWITGYNHRGIEKLAEDKTLEQCYEDLNKRAQELERRSKELSQSISQERYNQLSLSQQITYMQNKIAETENAIQRIEVELETKNVEIRMIQRDIEETRNNIETISQETNNLENSIEKRITISYKYSFLNPLELILKTEDFDMLFRKLKYLNESRRNDRIILENMFEQNAQLDQEKASLEGNQLSLENTRIEVENKKKQLFAEKQNLASQQATHANLLEQSRKNEASYEADLAEARREQDQVTEMITAIIRQMYERGQIALDRRVSRGEIIGFQGYTGFTYGSHLHFEVYNSGGRVNPFAAGFFTGGNLYGVVGPNTYHQPLAGGILTQTYHGGHRAIDLVSRSHGDQTGGTYQGAEIRCYGMVRRAGRYNSRGTGAPVHAVTDGYVSGMLVDACGGKYVILKHDDGGSSLYLHLQ